MSATHCLNCKTSLHGKYCHACGQTSSTHRLSLGHFLIHDAVHGLWHVDGSFLYTLGQVVRRPGKAALEYIAGKRRKYFNLVTLLLLIAGTTVFVRHKLKPEGAAVALGKFAARTEARSRTDDSRVRIIEGTGAEFIAVDTTGALDGDRRPARLGRRLQHWIEDNEKWMLLGFIPIISMTSLVAYRRARFNYTEHLVVAAFCLAGALTVGLACSLLQYGLVWATGVHFSYGKLAVFLFVLMVYWQAHRHRYSIGGWTWRTVAALLLFMLLFLVVVIAGGVLAAYLTEGPAFFKDS